jgi:hypothetical protein
MVVEDVAGLDSERIRKEKGGGGLDLKKRACKQFLNAGANLLY